MWTSGTPDMVFQSLMARLVNVGQTKTETIGWLDTENASYYKGARNVNSNAGRHVTHGAGAPIGLSIYRVGEGA